MRGLAQVTPAFGAFHGLQVPGISMLTFKLAVLGPAEALGRAAVGFHFRHIKSFSYG